MRIILVCTPLTKRLRCVKILLSLLAEIAGEIQKEVQIMAKINESYEAMVIFSQKLDE